MDENNIIQFDLREFNNLFQSASEIQRRYNLGRSTVKEACKRGAIRCWRMGRDWVVYVPDAMEYWKDRIPTDE
jgi:hypothetical protein